MSCGIPQDVPSRQMPGGVFTPASAAGPAGRGTTRPGTRETARSARQPAEGHGSPAARTCMGGQAIPPGPAAGTAPGSPARSSRTAAGGGILAREDLPPGPSGENLAAARAAAARS